MQILVAHPGHSGGDAIHTKAWDTRLQCFAECVQGPRESLLEMQNPGSSPELVNGPCIWSRTSRRSVRTQGLRSTAQPCLPDQAWPTSSVLCKPAMAYTHALQTGGSRLLLLNFIWGLPRRPRNRQDSLLLPHTAPLMTKDIQGRTGEYHQLTSFLQIPEATKLDGAPPLTMDFSFSALQDRNLF